MPAKQVEYTDEEVARRGDELYDRVISQEEKEQHKGRIAAIDIETGDYEIDDDELTASDRLLARHPVAEIWFVRIGDRAVHRLGGHGIQTAR
jgi:hypothetical protein